jgi:DNA polymerase elongation subunit (family B)
MGTVFTSYKGVEKDVVSIAGAYVFEPIPGLYKDGIAVVDYSSLYPSIFRILNISIETYIGKISRFPIDDPTMDLFVKEPPIDLNNCDIIGERGKTDNDRDYESTYGKKYENLKPDHLIEKFYLLPANGGKQKIITRKQLDELLETKCIFTRNNTLFLKHSVKQGLISSWCTHFYNLRKKTKNSMQKLEMDIYNGVVDKDKIKETKERIQNLNDKQQSLKILINSCYGLTGTSFSPIYNPYISQTITLSGRFFNLSTSQYINNKFNEKYGTKNAITLYVDEHGNKHTTYSVSGDTDSTFFHTKLRIIREK